MNFARIASRPSPRDRNAFRLEAGSIEPFNTPKFVCLIGGWLYHWEEFYWISVRLLGDNSMQRRHNFYFHRRGYDGTAWIFGTRYRDCHYVVLFVLMPYRNVDCLEGRRSD